MNYRLNVYLGIAFLAGCVGAQVMRIPPATAQNASTTRWEVFCQRFHTFGPPGPEEVASKATAAGAEGWEFVLEDHAHNYCFKRPRK
jgi:hypothetical protein